MKWGLVPSFAKCAEDYDVFKGGSSTFNARVEGLDSSGMWRRLLDSRRGVVLFDGFYEWKTVGKDKKPMFIRNRDEYKAEAIPSEGGPEKPICDTEQAETQSPVLPVQDCSPEAATQGPAHAPLMMAALYDEWRPQGGQLLGAEEGDVLETVTLVTMESDGTPVAAVHDRMPVFLTPDTAATWLDTSASFGKVIGPVLSTARDHAREQLCMYEVSTLVSNVKNESPDCVLPKKELDAKQFSKGLGKFFTKKASAENPAVAQSSEAPAASKRKLACEETSGVAGPPTKVARRAAAEECIVLD